MTVYSAEAKNYSVNPALYPNQKGDIPLDQLLPKLGLGKTGPIFIESTKPNDRFKQYSKICSNYFFVSNIDNNNDFSQEVTSFDNDTPRALADQSISLLYCALCLKRIGWEEAEVNISFEAEEIKNQLSALFKKPFSNNAQFLEGVNCERIYLTFVFPYIEKETNGNDKIRFRFFNHGNINFKYENRYFINCQKDSKNNIQLTLICPLKLQPKCHPGHQAEIGNICYSNILTCYHPDGDEILDQMPTPTPFESYNGDFFNVNVFTKDNLNYQRIPYTESEYTFDGDITTIFNFSMSSIHKMMVLLTALSNKGILLGNDKFPECCINTLLELMRLNQNNTQSNQKILINHGINEGTDMKFYLETSLDTTSILQFEPNQEIKTKLRKSQDNQSLFEQQSQNDDTSFDAFFEQPETTKTETFYYLPINRYLITVEPAFAKAKQYCLSHFTLYSNMELKFLYIDADLMVYSVFHDNDTLYLYQSDIGTTSTEDMYLMLKIQGQSDTAPCIRLAQDNNNATLLFLAAGKCYCLNKENNKWIEKSLSPTELSNDSSDEVQCLNETIYCPLAIEISNRVFLLSDKHVPLDKKLLGKEDNEFILSSLYHPPRNISMLSYHIESIFNRFFTHTPIQTLLLDEGTVIYAQVDIGYAGRIDQIFGNSLIPGLYEFAQEGISFISRGSHVFPTCYLFFANGKLGNKVMRYRTKCQLAASFLFAFGLCVFGPRMQVHSIQFHTGTDQYYSLQLYRRLLVAAYGTLIEMPKHFELAFKIICKIAKMDNIEALFDRFNKFVDNLRNGKFEDLTSPKEAHS